MLLATRSALAADGHLLEPAERDAVDGLMAQLQDVAATGSDAAAIAAATEALAKGTEAFAARRMNQSIRQALAGRNVETL